MLKKIRQAFFKKPWELHADNWDGRNIGKVWAKVWNEVKWSYLTISNLISYTGTIMSFGNRVQNFLISKFKISTTFWSFSREGSVHNPESSGACGGLLFGYVHLENCLNIVEIYRLYSTIFSIIVSICKRIRVFWNLAWKLWE